MSINRLTQASVFAMAASLALALTPAAMAAPSGQAAVATTQIKSNPVLVSVESESGYHPAETVKGKPRPLPTAATSGISSQALLDAQAYAESMQSFAFVVMRDGKLVHEYYAPGFSRANRFSPASMHKTVMALTFGTAHIPLEAPVSRWLTEWRDDPRGAITVRQLLTMSSGLEVPMFGGDANNKSSQLMFGNDLTNTALSFARATDPGKEFSYINANSELAGIILQRATGKRYAQYLSQKIWQPIGASDATVWLDKPMGTAHFFCCLQASALDYARVGQLILDGGRVGMRQVVPAAWLTEMTRPSALNPNYGLQVWRGSPYTAIRKYSTSSPLVGRAAKPYLRDDVLFMDGAIGQRVYVIPSERLVIVRIGKSNMAWDDSELPNRLLAGITPR